MRQTVRSLLLGLLLCGVAPASIITGTIAVNLGNLSDDTPGNLQTNTRYFTVGSQVVATSGDFTCPLVTCVAAGTVVNLPIVQSGTLIGDLIAFARYDYTVTSQDPPTFSTTISNGLKLTNFAIHTSGVFHDTLGIVADEPAVLGITGVESCVAGSCSIAGAVALATNLDAVPEPSTLLLAGSMMLLVLVRQRRK